MSTSRCVLSARVPARQGPDSVQMQTFTVEEEPDSLRPKQLDLESAGSDTDVGIPVDYKAQAL